MYKNILAVLCLFLVLLSACTAPFVGQGPAATPTSRLIAPTSTPTLTPTLTALQAAEARVLHIMAGMSLQQKLGQLIVAEFVNSNYQSSGLQQMITQQYVGGFLYQYSNGNFNPPENTVASVAAFSQQAQKDAAIPLLIGTDQEGGLVNRLKIFHGPLPSAETMAATGNPEYALNQGKQSAQWMVQLGINTDLAPVVDVQTVSPSALPTRMFGSTPQAVVTYAGAFLQGLQQNGVAGCLKHFPGLGASPSDPHFGLPVVNRSMNDLENIDLAPYKSIIAEDHPALIMDTDVLMPAIDPTMPAELSPKAVNGLLRGELGYNGVVITDGLYMHGISERWSIGQAAVLALLAGDDLLEGPASISSVAEVLSALNQALQNGTLTEARVDQSVARILLMKIDRGIIH